MRERNASSRSNRSAAYFAAPRSRRRAAYSCCDTDREQQQGARLGKGRAISIFNGRGGEIGPENDFAAVRERGGAGHLVKIIQPA
jgi:hypothetical protein